jgi:cellulose synthase/poly-beta-1,6-N-acetylglucosamine synthase-like glycosyltransferase
MDFTLVQDGPFQASTIFQLPAQPTSSAQNQPLPINEHASTLRQHIEVIHMAIFVTIFLLRYVRTVVSIVTFITYKAKPVLAVPTFTGATTTVVIPTTFKEPHKLLECIGRIFNEGPLAIFVVTAFANVPTVQQLCDEAGFGTVLVRGVEHLNKRAQLLTALRETITSIVVLADDDVFWPSGYLQRLLAIFEDPKVGAGGTRQRVRREKADFWNMLGISYLERRVWNNISTNAIDGSISTLSGRTAAYRTEILQTEEFFQYFNGDTWRGKPLNSDDDKCLTRYVYSHDWNICIQSDPAAILETTVEDNSKYLNQCMRWARAHWRGNLTVMEEESYWCSLKFSWGLYVIYFGQWQTPAFL